ncbi:HCP-like protein [Backusella circina FSU 941]|nr:HCP-like protein [Backusella circina FSU 941]
MLSVFKKKTNPFIEDELITALTSDQITVTKDQLKKINKGDKRTLHKMGTQYLNRKNYTKSLRWYLMSGRRNYAPSQNKIGWMTQHGLGVPSIDYTSAMHWYLKAERNGSVRAANNIGSMYLKGCGVPVDNKMAMVWFRKSANKGFDKAQNNMGEMYLYGLGVPVDYKRAMRWFCRAAVEHENIKAQKNMGKLYLDGLGIPVDNEIALEWYLKPAIKGNMEAQYTVGWLYDLKLDHIAAMYWYLKAAKKGHSLAQNNIGYLYHHGTGIPVDYRMAMVWYSKSLRNDENYYVQSNIGCLYRDGLGVTQDIGVALDWFLKAAEQGYATAQNYLGNLYENVDEIKDIQRAILWYQKATKNGNESAQKEMALSLSDRNTIHTTNEDLDHIQYLNNGLLPRTKIQMNQVELLNNKIQALETDVQQKMHETDMTYRRRVKDLERERIKNNNRISQLEEMLAQAIISGNTNNSDNNDLCLDDSDENSIDEDIKK